MLNSHGFSVCSFVVAFHLECASNQSSLALSRLTALCLTSMTAHGRLYAFATQPESSRRDPTGSCPSSEGIGESPVALGAW